MNLFSEAFQVVDFLDFLEFLSSKFIISTIFLDIYNEFISEPSTINFLKGNISTTLVLLPKVSKLILVSYCIVLLQRYISSCCIYLKEENGLYGLLWIKNL